MANPVGTRDLVLHVDGTDFSDSVKMATVKSRKADGGFGSFAEVRAGGPREYYLALTIRQDTDASTLHDYIWSQLGSEQDVEVWPHGYNGGTATTAYPQYTGTVIISEPDGDVLGGEANESPRARWSSEVEWVFLVKPTKVTA